MMYIIALYLLGQDLKVDGVGLFNCENYFF